MNLSTLTTGFAAGNSAWGYVLLAMICLVSIATTIAWYRGKKKWAQIFRELGALRPTRRPASPPVLRGQMISRKRRLLKS